MIIVPLGELRRTSGGGDTGPESWSAGVPPRSQAAVTIGVFDSLHIGHQKLIREVVDNGLGALPVVCTFRQNPGSVLGTRRLPGSILSFGQKMARLEAMGVAEVVLIDFSPEISKMTGKGFIELLQEYVFIRKLVVGYNFHMGRDRATGVEQLRGIIRGSETELVVVPATHHNGRAVSSSGIRETIRDGNFSEVQAMMGGAFCLDLRDVAIEVRGTRAKVRGDALGQVLPKPGEYPVAFITPSVMHSSRLSVLGDAVEWTKQWQESEIEICFARDKVLA